MKKIHELSEIQLSKLVDNRWKSSETLWDQLEKQYDRNVNMYKNDPEWLKSIAKQKSKIRANRIFSDMETVINSLIANPARPIVLPGRTTPQSKQLAKDIEKYFQIKYDERNVKEQIRKGLRNLYFGRLIVLKPFWNAKINDFDVRVIDPRKVRVGKRSTKEDDTEFAIEELCDDITAVLRRFPAKKEAILEKFGFKIEDEDDALILNPEVKYKEAWIRDYVIFKMDDIILGCVRNPYWDWDGLLLTPQEEEDLNHAQPEQRRSILQGAKDEQEMRKEAMAQKILAEKSLQTKQGETGEEGEIHRETAPNMPEDELPINEGKDEQQTFEAYFFNHFDQPRKPYIFATIFNNENTPIGQTDMICQATPLQEGIDEAKQDISENRRLVNGQIKVDSSVMTKADAQKLRYEARGLIWGKGVKDGVTREMGTPLPNFVMEDMIDSRKEIDEIMASSSAFKGNREGQETKAGRLALIDQSFLRLNELVQVIDYCNYELFNWFFQLAKIRYTEHHYAKTLGKDKAVEIITLIQDDFEDGSEIRIIPGKTLPEDRSFKYEQAQNDIKNGVITPTDYLEAAGYESPEEKAKNRVIYDLNKPMSVGITPEELKQIAPQPPEDPPKLSITYADLPPDGKVQMAAKAGIQLDPQIVVAEELQKQNTAKQAAQQKASKLQANNPKANGK